jgi:hypothetical protein
MADMSQWQGKSQKRHNLDRFAVMSATVQRRGPWQALVNHIRASINFILRRIARFPSD